MWAHQYINADWGFAWSRSSSAYWLLALICTTTCERTPRPLCPAGTATSSPAWRKAPVQFLCLRLKWMAAFEECATFTCFVSVFTCRTRLFSALKEKGRHASLIIHRLSAPLPRSLLWVQRKGRNQLPWIQLPQWGGGGVSWCREVVLSKTESQCWFSSAAAFPSTEAVACFQSSRCRNVCQHPDLSLYTLH